MRYPLDNFTITQGFHSGHMAIDLASPHGTLVKSPVAGTVIAVGTNPNYIGGRYVIVREDSPNRYENYTGHHSGIHVSVGQRVAEGQHIADVGATGQATGPHVHFQIRQFNGGALLNPTTVFNQYNQGGQNMTIPDADNWYYRMNKLMLQIRGRGLSREEFRKNFVGVEPFRMVEILSDDAEADRAQEAQQVGQVAQRDKWDQQIYALQDALKNEQNKPPKEVIKEVEKIVTKEVKVEVPVYTHDEETKQNVNKILSMVTSIFDYFKGQYKTFSKYIKKG